MVRRVICLLAVLYNLPPQALAQAPPDPTAAIEAVSQTAFMEGEWAGAGWIRVGEDLIQDFTQVETVKPMLDGALLVIEGVGHSTDEDPKKIHHAMAVISYDPVEDNLVFSSYMAGRPRLDLVPEVGENTLKWGFSPPNGGHVRYTLVVEGDTWHEVGEFSRDGEEWYQFFEMQLERQ